jgi:hypothetical protein
MRIITQVLAMEVNVCVVVSISRAGFKHAQSSREGAQDAEAPARAERRELQPGLRVWEFGRPRVKALKPRQES